MHLGVVLVLPNRAAGAAAKQMSIAENITLPSLQHYGRFGFIRRRSEDQASAAWIDKLRDPAPRPRAGLLRCSAVATSRRS